MQIPIFVSSPTDLNPEQQGVQDYILKKLEDLNLVAHTLGRSDYPMQSSLHEVYVLGRHCSGAVILGFEQTYAERAVSKRGSAAETVKQDLSIPTPWNHLEAGIMFSLRIPLLILREPSITGGIFDAGTVDGFVHALPAKDEPPDRINQILQRWSALVMGHYYRA
jgi:hypothetical protein